MQTARELDANKFPQSPLKMEENIYYKSIQEEVKVDVRDREDSEADGLFKLTNSFLPKRELAEQIKKNEKSFTDSEKFFMIMRATSEQSGITIDRMKKHRHFRNIVIPRSIVIFLTRYVTTLSLNQIGRVVVDGVKMDHSTIIHACNRVKEAIDIRQQNTYQLLLQVVGQLQDEGLYIDFRFSQPDWYVRMLNKQERIENKTLVSG